MQYRSTSEADRAVESRALERAVGLGMIASVVVVVVATLAPFQLAVPKTMRVVLAIRASDVLLNLALLAPLGFALGMRAQLARRGHGPVSPCVQAFAIGFALSAALEVAQMFVPSRCPSPSDALANALGCAGGCWLQAKLGVNAERWLLSFLRTTPSAGRVASLTIVLGLIAASQIETQLLHDSFQWTVGPAPMVRSPRAIVISLIASLGIAAWLGFALRSRSRSALTALTYALPIVTAIEVCRGYCNSHAASLLTIALAAMCALVSAHAADRVRISAQPARRIWV